MNKKENNELYDLLVDTLMMVNPDRKNPNPNEFEEHLVELEGDYYTFFHIDNLKKLQNENKLNLAQVNKIQKIRHLIENIEPALWNVQAFMFDKSWIEVSVLALDVLKSLGINKR